MANKSVSELDAASTIEDDDLFLLSDNSDPRLSKKITWNTIKEHIIGIIDNLISSNTSTVDKILSQVYPVGTIYTTVENSIPFRFGTWIKIAEGRCLFGTYSGHSAGDEVDAGLPNIYGTFGCEVLMHTGTTRVPAPTGCFGVVNSTRTHISSKTFDPGNQTMVFDASKSNQIYGKSLTVQPPAYIVNFFRRTS